jgi:hypothetical protein
MKKLLSVVAVLAMSLGLTTAVSAPAQARPGWDLSSPFAREVVRPGDIDRDTYHVEHVYELQYRLKWAGLLAARPNGVFGPKTERAVKLFQKRRGFKQSGVVGYRMWSALIQRTVRGKGAVPQVCKSDGWHACYDRWRHQVNLYHNGRLLNSWLVRGGGYDVQWRSKDHRSGLYDGAPMPYSQFFSGGQALHGSRYMLDPFEGHSHGCVNFWVEDARQLWNLTHDKKLHVHVYGAWD